MLNPESNIFIYWHCLVIDDIESIICTRYKHDIFNEEIILSAYTKETQNEVVASEYDNIYYRFQSIYNPAINT